MTTKGMVTTTIQETMDLTPKTQETRMMERNPGLKPQITSSLRRFLPPIRLRLDTDGGQKDHHRLRKR